MISVRDLHKVFRQGETEVRALAGVSLDIAAGEFVSIMGPSGSGKSTLLHLMGGLDVPTAGEIVIEGTPISRMSDDEITIFRRRKIGFVFQFFNLLPMLSAEENVALPLSIAGEKPDSAFFEQLLERVGLTDRRKHRPSELSGGQQQRVAIARALVSQPTVVFADEPTGNLDSQTGAEILALLQLSAKEHGQTMVMVTHDAHAAEIADRVLFLADGQIVEELPGSGATEILAAMARAGS